ncbi:type VI secretion system protein ImpG [Paraburkholderia sacchari]|uniref:type VI secretion system baseplate subunit TssF n=1 Tax=Paraburkholderia sacchari TaxID=159450 RepID=UPI0039A6E877
MTAPWKPFQREGSNPFLSYFDAEMRYLREAGRDFARNQPDAARRLGMQYGQEYDQVRAVNEGFALLMARLRMKLDDAMPELTEGLLDNLYEHMARTIPSLSVIECVPLNRRDLKAAQIPAGAVVRSAPIGPAAVQCPFRTTQAVDLLPLSVEDAEVAVRADGRTVIRLTFGLWFADQRAHADLSRIRLYLDGDRPAAAALYAALTRQVAAIGLRLPSVRDGELQPLDGVRFEPAGFGASTRLWPVTNPQRDESVDREQTLLEYFVFPQKFHFVDLCGFDSARVPAGETRMTFEIELNGHVPGDHPLGRESFRLFCTPVINLFEVDALPLQPIDWHDREHSVRADSAVADHVEPWDLIAVTATDPEGSAQHTYQPFTSFRHRGWLLRYEKPERYFHSATRYGVNGRELWVTLAGQLWAGTYLDSKDDDGDRPQFDRHVTLRALANNGRLPRLALTEATITGTVSGFTGIASVRNVTAPSLPQYPPRYFPGYDWRVLGHYTANGQNEFNRMLVEGARVLREVLELYDWTADDAIPQRIGAIRTVRFSEDHVRIRGLVRVVRIHVDLDASGFDGPGDAVLFGDVLNHFLGRYASPQYSTQTVLTIDGQETVYPRTDFTRAPF